MTQQEVGSETGAVAVRKVSGRGRAQKGAAQKAARGRGNGKRKAVPARESTRHRATRLAISLVEFNKATFDTTVRMLGAIQSQTEKAVHQLVSDATWLPKEGKKVVDEWIRAMRRTREDFKRTTDRSFDLIAEYLKRVQAGDGRHAKR